MFNLKTVIAHALPVIMRMNIIIVNIIELNSFCTLSSQMNL